MGLRITLKQNQGGRHSSLLDKLLFDGAGDAQVDLQDLGHQHLDYLVFVVGEIFLDLGDLDCGLLLQRHLEFLVLLLNDDDARTLSRRASNSWSFCWRYLLTSCSAGSLASLSLRCLHEGWGTFLSGRCWWSRWRIARPWVVRRCRLSRSWLINQIN